MPGVQLPLRIFEPRYLNLVQDALAADHLIGMIQPLGGQEGEKNPPLHRIGCAGRITSYNETNDGRLLLVLTGVCRFAVSEELPRRRGYRLVRPNWERFVIDYHPENDALADHKAFLDSLHAYSQMRGVEIPWNDIQALADIDLVNLLCAHLPLPPNDKQALIESIALADRAELMRGLMEMSAISSVADAERPH